METVTVKMELDRDDISVMMRLLGTKLTDEQWDKIKGKECMFCDEDLGDQAVRMRVTFSAYAVGKLFKAE